MLDLGSISKSLCLIYKKNLSNAHFKNFTKFIIGGIIAILLSYAGNYLINRKLSKEDLGQFSYYFNIMSLLTSLASLNVFQAYLRFNNTTYNQRFLRKLVLQISLISSVILFFIAFIINRNIYISAFAFFILFNERIYYFRSMIRIEKMNLLKYLSSIFLFVFLISLIITNIFSYEKAILCYGLSYILVFIIGIFIDDDNRKLNTNNEGVLISPKLLLQFSIPVTFTVFITWISQVSDQILMKRYLSLTGLGNYAMGYRIIVIIRIFTSLFLLYYPMLYFEEAAKKNFAFIRRIRGAFIFILFMMTIILIIGRKYLYIFMGANNYLGYTNIFILLAISEFINISSDLFLTFRVFTLQNWYGTICITICGTISLILNLIFLKKYGIYFAALNHLGMSLIYLIIVYILAIVPEKVYFKYA